MKEKNPEMKVIFGGKDCTGGSGYQLLSRFSFIEYVGVTDEEAMQAFHQLTRLEGILPALESAHAIAHGMKLAAEMRPDQTVLINLSGRGDKDVQTVAELEGISL